MSKGLKLGLAAVAVVAVLAVGAFFFISQRNRAPSSGLVRAAVEKIVEHPGLKLTSVTSTVTPAAEPGRALVAYQAKAEVTEPLYELADPTALLRDELKLDPDAWQNTRRILSGKTAPRILELAGMKNLDTTLLQSTFLHETTARGTELSFSGKLRAVKGHEGWELESANTNPAPGELRGKPRGAYAGATRLIDDPEELRKLRALAAAQVDVPDKIEAGRQAFLEERKAEQQKIIADLLDSINVGTVFGGTAAIEGNQPVKIFLEFTGVNLRSKQVTALLRNDGNWTDKRPLTGRFAFDADSETLTIALATKGDEAVADAGPLLADDKAWNFVFQLNGGKLTVRDDRHDISLNRLSEAEVTAVRKDIESTSAALFEAADAGKIYRGVIRSRNNPQTFDYVLRFNQQDRGDGTVMVTLAPAGRDAWQRNYTGTVIANRYHTGGLSLHLETQASDAVKSADSASPAGLNHDSDVSLRLVSGHFQGEGADFSYDFAPLSADEVAKLQAAAAAQMKSLLAIVKQGTAYPGAASHEGDSTAEKIQLRFRRVDPHGDAIDAVIESPEHPGVSRDFHGSLDSFAKRLTLTSGRLRGSASSRAGLSFPPLSRSDGQLLALDITDSALSGELQGEGQGWKMNFPVAGGTAVTGNLAGDYPAESGAYVWNAGAWQPLPRNDGKVSKSALKAIGGFFNSLGKSSNAPATADKVADLVFSGHDTVPTVPGGDVRVLYVGAIKGDRSEKYPQLEGYPDMEMAPTTRDSSGHRKVVLTRIAPNVPVGGFRERRVPANLERVSDTVIELSCTRRLAAGSYAISVNDDAFELKVE
jgi:hypothetical protein